VKTLLRSFHLIRNGILLTFQEEPEGGYTVTVPALPGCVSYGKTFEEALEMAKDAMGGWLAVAQEEGVDIPEPFLKIEIAGL
jgi:predicted RNase H-like HicB family nuclease